MKIKQHTYPDGWSTFSRHYATQSAIEKHLISWLEEKLPDLTPKNLDRLFILVNLEITGFAKWHRGKMGSVTIQKIVAGWYVGGRVSNYKLTLTSPRRFPFFEISEPIS
jgi:hypothetical protein